MLFNSSFPAYKILRMWTVLEMCSINVTYTQKAGMMDITDPVFYACPSDTVAASKLYPKSGGFGSGNLYRL
ncbi:MAG: hypothetical protein R2784_06935 [Saprospiraceae bacterium]